MKQDKSRRKQPILLVLSLFAFLIFLQLIILSVSADHGYKDIAPKGSASTTTVMTINSKMVNAEDLPRPEKVQSASAKTMVRVKSSE